MKGILKFILFLEIVLLCSCVNDEKRSGAFGGMSLHLSANSSVTDVTTRSSEEVLPSIQDFSISVLQGDKVQASWDKLSDYDEDTTFPVGSYTLKLSMVTLRRKALILLIMRVLPILTSVVARLLLWKLLVSWPILK